MPVRGLLAFNRGLVSPLALARVDIKRLQLAAEVQTNWMPRTLGPMMLRPGLGHVTSTRNDGVAKYIDFVYSASSTALIEFTSVGMRVLIDDVVIRRPAVSSKLDRWNSGTSSWDASTDTTSDFASSTDVGYWKDNDETGAASSWNSGGHLALLGTGSKLAIRDRRVTVANIGIEHSIDIVVRQGTVNCSIGSSEGGSDYLAEKLLRTGWHSLSVTPTGTAMFIRLSNDRDVTSLVDSVTLGQAAADMVVPTPWQGSDLDYVRWHQEGDVVFVACHGFQQRRIERQGSDSPRSWSVVEYAPEDGPFREINTGPVQLKGSALTGDIVLTADRAFFKSAHVGALFSLTSQGQVAQKTFTTDGQATDPIRVTGVADGRTIGVRLDGTYAAGTKIRLQRSIAEPGAWVDVKTWTAPTSEPYNDELDNQIIYYRLATSTGDYVAPDAPDGTLSYAAGSITGIVRIRNYSSPTSVEASVLKALGKADQYTQDWREGDWSDRRGWPSAVAMFGGRLFWFGKGYEWGSVPDGFDSFDQTIEGDSAPIRRSIGEGPVDAINWGLRSDNLLIGLEGAVVAARSSTLDEPLTQARFDLKPIGDMGTAAVPAVRSDVSAIFVGGNGERVYEVARDSTGNYPPPDDLTGLVPEIGAGGFVRRAYQRFPDRRLHLVRADGKVAILVFDKLEQVRAWIEVETDGVVEDVVVLPGAVGAKTEDRVYYVVRRTINRATKRFLEKWATEAQAIGAADNRIADCHITGTASGSPVITGLDHLEGRTVCLWANGKDLGTYTVSGGYITATEVLTGPYCVGLPYEARYKSAKRALADVIGMMLTERKKIDAVGLVLANTHAQGLRYGPSFEDDDLDDLPQVEEGATVAADTIHVALDTDPVTFPGRWGTDPRLCLVATAPRPCTVLGAALVESER